MPTISHRVGMLDNLALRPIHLPVGPTLPMLTVDVSMTPFSKPAEEPVPTNTSASASASNTLVELPSMHDTGLTTPAPFPASASPNSFRYNKLKKGRNKILARFYRHIEDGLFHCVPTCGQTFETMGDTVNHLDNLTAEFIAIHVVQSHWTK